MTHSKSSTDVDKDQHATVSFEPGITDGPDAGSAAHDTPLNIRMGQQLRAAREARQLDIEACGHELRLPVRVLRQLEAGDYTGISHGVYLRNYLTSYAACVGLSGERVRDTIRQLVPEEKRPDLVSTGGVSRSHYLWQRYTTAATYAVLTAVIVVPLVWLGLKGGLDRELAHLEPLNAAPVAENQTAARTPSTRASATHRDQTGALPPAATSPAERPLMASMAPFSALDSVDELSRPVTPPVVSVPGSHTLGITLTKPSWVEVSTRDGQRLEYSLLPAGAHKVYHSNKPLQVDIGDTSGATVSLDGKPVNLDAYRHANVAHFQVALKHDQAVIQAR